MHTSVRKPGMKRFSAGDIIVWILLTLLALITFMPFYNAVVISFETNRAYALNPVSLYPIDFTMVNYEYLVDKG